MARGLAALRAAVWLGGFAPLAWLVRAGLQDDLTADPVKYLTHVTGKTALVILLVTLAVTPLRQITGRGVLARIRRPVGLFAFAYATLHLLIYFVFDRGMVLLELGADIAKRPYITVGFTAWVFLLLLALTSPTSMVRWLGGRRWQRLHRLVYPALALGFLHFGWAQKRDLLPLLPYAAGALAVLALRGWAAARARPAAAVTGG